MPLEAGFVRTRNDSFVLNDKPFHVAGANNYYLGFGPDLMVLPVFDLAVRGGLNTLRTWAFLDCGAAFPDGPPPPKAKDGVYFQYQNAATGQPQVNNGPNGLERLDRTIFTAEKLGVRLILPFVNNWDDFGGMRQYLEWFALTRREDFFRDPDVRSAYRNYVEHLLRRVNPLTGREYRDEPAVLAWELANEPRCVGDDGRPLRDGIDTLLQWADEMSSFIRTVDSNHLIGVGDEGFLRRTFHLGDRLYDGSSGVDCERLLAVPNIDFGTFHLYPAYSEREDPIHFGTRWIQEHIEAGQRANKPMLLEEFGVKIDSGEDLRAATLHAWLDQVDASGGAGALLWMIAAQGANGEPYPDYDHYTLYEAEELRAIFRTGDASPTVAFGDRTLT